MDLSKIEKIRREFPIFNNGSQESFIYFDSAATTQKPACVIDSISEAYCFCNANVHRGTYRMSREATEHHENARQTIANWIGASPEEIIFTSGTTASLNMVAYSFGDMLLKQGDSLVTTLMEHHSNFVPWQQLALRKNALLHVVSLTETGEIDREAFTKVLSDHPKIVAIAHVSNVLGTVNPVKELVAEAHEAGAFVVVDGAQAIAHRAVNVKEINADFYAFSGHKMYGPTGIGVLYGKRKLLEEMPPFFFGGEMIDKVTTERTTFAPLPYKFEAGTPDFVSSVALAKAVDFINRIGFDTISQHEQLLLHKLTDGLETIEGIRILGSAPCKEAVVTFVCDGVHPYDLGILLDELGFALRSGHHCAEPLMNACSVTATLRASMGIYNTEEEVDKLIHAVQRAVKILRR